jgi:hypothetical protein
MVNIMMNLRAGRLQNQSSTPGMEADFSLRYCAQTVTKASLASYKISTEECFPKMRRLGHDTNPLFPRSGEG